MKWSDWDWKEVKGRRNKRRSQPQPEDSEEDSSPEEDMLSCSMELHKAEATPAPAPRAADLASSILLRRTEEFFKNPPEWKILVENTFISVRSWRDRSSRTSVSAPARLVTSGGCGDGAGGSPRRPAPSPTSPAAAGADSGGGGDTGGGCPKPLPPTAVKPELQSKASTAHLAPAASTKPPSPRLSAEQAQRASAVAEVTPADAAAGTPIIRTAEEATSPKRRKQKTKGKGPVQLDVKCEQDSKSGGAVEQHFAPNVLPQLPSAVATSPLSSCFPTSGSPQGQSCAGAKSLAGMTVVKKRKGRNVQIERSGTSLEEDDEAQSEATAERASTRTATCDASDDASSLVASPTNGAELNSEATVEALEDEDEASPIASTPSGKSARRARKRAAKAAAKANQASMQVAAKPAEAGCEQSVASKEASAREEPQWQPLVLGNAVRASLMQRQSAFPRQQARVAASHGMEAHERFSFEGSPQTAWPSRRPTARRGLWGASRQGCAPLEALPQSGSSCIEEDDEDERLPELEPDLEQDLQRRQERLAAVKLKIAKANEDPQAQGLRNIPANHRLLNEMEGQVREAEIELLKAAAKERRKRKGKSQHELVMVDLPTQHGLVLADRGGAAGASGPADAAGEAASCGATGDAAAGATCDAAALVTAALAREKASRLAGSPMAASSGNSPDGLR